MSLSYSFVYVVLNGGTYLWYNLKNALALCQNNPRSEIIIVEGSDNFRDSSEYVGGLSIDGTVTIIRSFSSDRIRYYPKGKVGDLRQLWNLALGSVTDTHYVVLCRAEEFLSLGDFKRLDKLLSQRTPDVVDLPIHYFWGDFYHRFPRALCPYEERVVKNIEGKAYIDWHDQLSLTSGGLYRDAGSCMKVDVPLYNYSLVYPHRRLQKEMRWRAKDKNYYTVSVDRGSFWQETDPGEYAQDQASHRPKQDILEVLPFTELEKSIDEDHSKLLRIHPFFRKTIEDIGGTPSYPTYSGTILATSSNHEYHTTGKILEVGCGPGGLLKELGEANRCYGLDPSRYAVEYGQKQGLEMMCSTLEQGWYPPDTFDLIIGLQTLEHTKQPIIAFKNMVRWLKPGGILILSTPDPQHEWTQDPKHFLWSPLQHYSIPSFQALSVLCEETELIVKLLKKDGHDIWLKAIKPQSTSRLEDLEDLI